MTPLGWALIVALVTLIAVGLALWWVHRRRHEPPVVEVDAEPRAYGGASGGCGMMHGADARL